MKKYKIIGIIIGVLLLVFGFFCIPVKASMTELSMISTNPGEDSSSQVRISWQSSQANCTIKYTFASDTSFASAKEMNISGVKNTVTYSGNESYYKYDVNLNDLQANTKYIYQIKAGSTTSSVYNFKTAGTKGKFNFAVIGDIHANASDSALKNADNLIKMAEEFTKDEGGIDFVFSQGDLVKYGQRYEDWQQWNDNYILKNYIFSTCPGNKEYYSTGHSITSYDWFMATFNNPDNGPSDLPTCYWFIYDSVLFFSLDNINPDAKNLTSSVQKWMEAVIKSNTGNYQYLIAVHHYADFYSVGNGICDWGSYNETWYKFFDKYGFDYVLSGDYHSYARSNQLYNNEVSTDPSKGTVYVTLPMVAPSVYSTTITTTNNPLIAKWTPNGSATHGASYFTVTNGSLTYHEFGGDGKIYDTVTVKPKQLNELSMKSMLNSVKIIQNEDKTTNVLYFSPDYCDIVNSISIRINDVAKAKFTPEKNNQNTYTLPSLNIGDKVSLNIQFANGSNKLVSCKYSLLPDFGSIYGFHGEIQNNKLTFSWKSELQNSVVSKFMIKNGDTVVANLTSDKNSFETSDLSLLSNEITFQALNSSDVVAYEEVYNYFRLGDYNKDSSIDKSDVNALKQAMLDENTSALEHDVDKDKRFDIYDLTLINLQANNNKELKTYYKVTFVDINGNTVSVQIVEKGKDASTVTFNDLDAYKFVGFDKSLKEIYQDTTITAVYELK